MGHDGSSDPVPSLAHAAGTSNSTSHELRGRPAQMVSVRDRGCCGKFACRAAAADQQKQKEARKFRLLYIIILLLWSKK